jgi:flagellar basal-body rod protein FlgB
MVRDLLITRHTQQRSLVMSNAIIFDKTARMIEDRLSLNSVNQKLISGNLANINTPGYRAKGVSFENALRQSLEEQVLQMVRTNGSHLAPDDPLQAMETQEVVDRGPVDLDTEMVNLLKNSIEYQHMVGMLNKKFSMLKTAITEGAV